MRKNLANSLIPLLAGLLLLIATTLAYLVNIAQTEVIPCMPFWSGCVSISRAVRSGPGLVLFKALAIPASVLMAVSWLHMARWASTENPVSATTARIMLWLGICAAAFLAVYVINLGLDGPVYRFMRRFGVNVFFGFTLVSQLLLIRILWPLMPGLSVAARKPVIFFAFVVSLEWLLGVGVTFKRLAVNDPVVLQQLENIGEWWFALLLVGAFILFGWIRAEVNSADN